MHFLHHPKRLDFLFLILYLCIPSSPLPPPPPLLLSAVSLSSCAGVPLTTSAATAELHVWPQFVCLATPSPAVSGGLIVLFQLKSLEFKTSVYPQRAHCERAVFYRRNLSDRGSSKTAIKQDRRPPALFRIFVCVCVSWIWFV